MPGCVLRATIPTENQMDDALRWFPLETLAILREGKLPRPTAARVSSRTGFNVLVSDYDDVERQAADAEAFLKDHHSALQRLVHESGANILLHFGNFFRKDFVTCQPAHRRRPQQRTRRRSGPTPTTPGHSSGHKRHS